MSSDAVADRLKGRRGMRQTGSERSDTAFVGRVQAVRDRYQAQVARRADSFLYRAVKNAASARGVAGQIEVKSLPMNYLGCSANQKNGCSIHYAAYSEKLSDG